MTDMHCHILPCVDDGAGSVEEACSMAWKAWENGTKRQKDVVLYSGEVRDEYVYVVVDALTGKEK